MKSFFYFLCSIILCFFLYSVLCKDSELHKRHDLLKKTINTRVVINNDTLTVVKFNLNFWNSSDVVLSNGLSISYEFYDIYKLENK